jgi:hypothetical protein
MLFVCFVCQAPMLWLKSLGKLWELRFGALWRAFFLVTTGSDIFADKHVFDRRTTRHTPAPGQFDHILFRSGSHWCLTAVAGKVIRALQNEQLCHLAGRVVGGLASIAPTADPEAALKLLGIDMHDKAATLVPIRVLEQGTGAASMEEACPFAPHAAAAAARMAVVAAAVGAGSEAHSTCFNAGGAGRRAIDPEQFRPAQEWLHGAIEAKRAKSMVVRVGGAAAAVRAVQKAGQKRDDRQLARLGEISSALDLAMDFRSEGDHLVFLESWKIFEGMRKRYKGPT